jgi:hypothetical protein
VEVGEAFDGIGTVEGEDRVQVRAERTVARLDLPSLALVGAEVLDLERSAVWNIEEPLPRRVDREATEIARDPASPEALCDDSCRAGADKAVRHEIVGIARELDDAFEETLRLLRVIPDTFPGPRDDREDVGPDVVERLAR